mgnify:CR=1 FL=1
MAAAQEVAAVAEAEASQASEEAARQEELRVAAEGPSAHTSDAPIPVAVNGVSTLREARTIYAVDRVVPSLKAESLTLIHFAPRTGRTHQLRRHAADVLRCPIVGDARPALPVSMTATTPFTPSNASALLAAWADGETRQVRAATRIQRMVRRRAHSERQELRQEVFAAAKSMRLEWLGVLGGVRPLWM